MTKYCGLKKANDLIGRRVKTTRPMSNGLGAMPAGTTGFISSGAIRNGKIGFKADKCSCCGFEWHVGGLSYDDFELI